jgi:ribosome biogenesis GTPase
MLFVGMVVRTDGPQVTVRDEGGRDWRCALRGRLRRESVGATSPVVVGDRVEVLPGADGEGAIERVLPRRSRLARRAVTGHDTRARDRGAPPPREHVLVANLDLAVVVVAVPPRPAVIDRFLTIVRTGGCLPMVCINKVDIGDVATIAPVAARYREADVPTVLTSALAGTGLDDLRRAIGSRFVAFIGPSGAGKSSLLNALDPSLDLRTGALNIAGKGSHTTSWVATFQVGDALIVDMPGLREIGFTGDEDAGAADDVFPEIATLAARCRFRNCTHTHEPRCAVKVALESGRLDGDLYQRYARLAKSVRV